LNVTSFHNFILSFAYRRIADFSVAVHSLRLLSVAPKAVAPTALTIAVPRLFFLFLLGAGTTVGPSKSQSGKW
jgi:hypothetical protein